jgi:hypothetical protein
LRLDEVVSELLEVPFGFQVSIRKALPNPKYTHTVVLMNENDVLIKKVLYDERTLEIFKNSDWNQKTRTTYNWDKVEIESLLLLHKAEMVKLVSNGLRWTIKDHGVINNDSIYSASKRITSMLYNFLGVRVGFNKNGRSSEYSDTQLYLNDIH